MIVLDKKKTRHNAAYFDKDSFASWEGFLNKKEKTSNE